MDLVALTPDGVVLLNEVSIAQLLTICPWWHDLNIIPLLKPTLKSIFSVPHVRRRAASLAII